MSNLFIKTAVRLHSGAISDFKIECDALTTEDLECLAYLAAQKLTFGAAIGIPRGGDRFAAALQQYVTLREPSLILVDDVLTTGGTMEQMKTLFSTNNVKGLVIFAREECPAWITPIFKYNLI